MSFTIVTDSSSNLTDQQIQEYGVSILSLSFFVSGREYQSYVKGQHNDLKKFYDMMRQKEPITTSLIRLSECRDLFEEILKQGQDLLFIGFSSALSGTYQAAETVAGELREEYPDRKIYTVDTLGALWEKGFWSITQYSIKKPEKALKKFTNGYWTIVCIWPTGLRWTTYFSLKEEAEYPLLPL